MPLHNRSLERGLAVLDCFRPGVGALTHRDIADRTGLPKPTVTRLVATLREQGWLVLDASNAYRLGVPVLSLSRSMSLADDLRRVLEPAIIRLAEETSTIIGFGTAHGGDIVYLAAHNGDPSRRERQVGAGMRAPIATTSVGRAWLAGLPTLEREAALVPMRATAHWRSGLDGEIGQAVREVAQQGHCRVLWSEGRHTAIGTPMPIRGAPLHALGIGYESPTGRAHDRVPERIRSVVQALRDLLMPSGISSP
ncbi:MAG: regulatory protein IclR [Rhizobacter sp.]|nr:regulatory protein IclR [Rhizobacter sp.]